MQLAHHDVILYHMNGSCKEPTVFTKSNAILYNHIHITQLPSTRHVYALADLFFKKPPLRLYFLLYVKCNGVKDGQHNAFAFYLQRAIVVVPQGNRSNFRIQKLLRKEIQ